MNQVARVSLGLWGIELGLEVSRGAISEGDPEQYTWKLSRYTVDRITSIVALISTFDTTSYKQRSERELFREISVYAPPGNI